MSEHRKRLDDFHALYDYDTDPGVTLARLVRAAGEFLTEIVGSERADKAMSIAISDLTTDNDSDGDWRDALDQSESNAFSEWPMGKLLHDLSAYARYGIDIDALADEDTLTVETRIADRVAAAEDFLSRCPLDEWLRAQRAEQLERTVAMARCRLALDRGQPVDPNDLAELANISQSRMRSLISGTSPELRREDGKIPASIALPWLEKRDEFLPSIWREQAPGSAEQINGLQGDRKIEPIFVPRAKDGSLFHPALAGPNGYRIGPKGCERTVPGFREALAALQAMETPYWRRPSDTTGTPGIVRGVEWVRVSAADFTADR